MRVPRTGVWFFPDADATRTVALARQAEGLGLDELWLGDEGPARDPFALLAAAAVRTERLRLGVAVTNPYLRHPAITAVAAMTVHELSGGRAILGLGPGGGIALGPLGIERKRPLERTRETVRIVRAVAAGVATEGYQPPPRPFTAPTLPVWIGSRGEGFNRYASVAADGAFLAGVPLPVLEVAIGWARSVRPIEIAIYLGVAFSDADAEAVRPRLVFSLLDAPDLNRASLGIGTEDARAAATAFAAGDDRPARRLISDEVLDQVLLRGTPEDIGRRLAGIVARHRPDSIGLNLLTPDLERGLAQASAALAIARDAHALEALHA